MSTENENLPPQSRWRRFFGDNSTGNSSSDDVSGPSKWSMGVLNDKETIEVPGSVLLLAQHRNEPLGLRSVHARTSHSSIPTGFPVEMPRPSTSSTPANPVPVDGAETKKMTGDGAIILEPQPEESDNDPLNWPGWRRDLALLSLGFYCMVGGGMTPIIAAGFTDVAETYHIEVESVSLTTGLYMMGLGVGSVVVSPTAILYGKRPVYLASAIVFIGMSLWAAWSPSFTSLLVARVFQGMAVSPVECLPSATIAEIFFLHERAFRIGIYTLLLLGGKNLIPLVSAAIIGRFGWRWVFWIVAMVVGVCFVLLFLFVPETFWDRTPHAKARRPSKRPSFLRRHSSGHTGVMSPQEHPADTDPMTPGTARKHKDVHVGFAPEATPNSNPSGASGIKGDNPEARVTKDTGETGETRPSSNHSLAVVPPAHVVSVSNSSRFNSTSGSEANIGYFTTGPNLDNEKIPASKLKGPPTVKAYTHNLRLQPAQSFTQQLRPWNGRLNSDSWFKVMMRPFILFAYPAVLWSSGVYACSVGWLIVVSESMAMIYRNKESYNFDALQTGLVYISPFLGGILGTGVAGKISDIIVKSMARRNGGLYEPEFRLVMAIPILITTCIGLMGFGWSADEKDHWIVPTVFFGVISFGCSLGSTTAITFCVDSYRQYAGEALVTLNFSKNILHGLVFSLFVTHWLNADGPKQVYIWIGIIQLILMLFTIPMYIYGKRARMWTVRMNLLEKF
ncbi:major facilitator superfamily domain-containing protein [Ilyonectria robusta]|uniref:major facilitator superfamily domain-containing protein n=1 Tax=Ilyonectria robusta TaxID=1079257 RepID=UPI001E8CEB68|nr:major facilitator superfamily domain-containing protein [Ilyonectria robusta]KAH8677007.1 major facilitator superfamily domain-containing protein [Ilyonectria robusta]